MMKTGIENQATFKTNGRLLPTASCCHSHSANVRIFSEARKSTFIVAQSFQRREQERQQLITMSLMHSSKPREQEHDTRLRNLHKSEAIKQFFRKLKSFRLAGQTSGVTCIEIPSPPTADPKTCTTWVQIDAPSNVAFHLCERNRRHFGRANGSL